MLDKPRQKEIEKVSECCCGEACQQYRVHIRSPFPFETQVAGPQDFAEVGRVLKKPCRYFEEDILYL